MRRLPKSRALVSTRSSRAPIPRSSTAVEQIAALAERNGFPAISFTRNFAMAGMLMSYGPDIGWMYRQAGGQIARILKGTKPADIPVMSRFASSSCST